MHVALKFGYEGWRFHGSQVQPGQRTVEGDISAALEAILGKEGMQRAKLRAASRTDAGVSALGNVLCVDVDMQPTDLVNALNANLDGIWVHSYAEVDEEFNPRHASSREYRYFLPKNWPERLNLNALKQAGPLVKAPGFLLDESPKDLAAMAHSESLLEASIGMATINSLLEVALDTCVELNAKELIQQKGEGKNVAIIGHFPFTPRVREKAKALWVIEKNPRQGDLPEEAADQYLPQADVVAITGTSLTNHTLDHLLKLCRPKAYVVMLGDTVPLSPVLFDYGVHAVSGTRVVDPDMALRCISQGSNFRQIKGIKKLTMTRSRP